MPTSMLIRSAAFAEGADIPTKHTCEGANVSPALEWSGVPTGAKTLALISDDPDAPDPKAPKRTWVHWVAWDIPPGAAGLAEAASPGVALPAGAREGLNDWNQKGWGGPCPPIGRHRYFFKLYALDAALGDLGKATKASLEAAMEGHVLARAQLMGTYKKKR